MKRLLLVVLLAALTLPTSATANRLPLRLVGTGGPPTSDAKRWVAWSMSSGPLTRVVDTRTGRARTLPVPPGCGDTPTLGGARLMWWCVEGTDASAVLHDLRTGTNQTVTLPADLREQDNPALPYGLGASWIAGRGPIPPSESRPAVFDFYFNWRTGEVRRQYDVSARFNRLPRDDRYADLDRPGLSQPLCAAHTRSGRRHALLQVVGRRALVSVPRGLMLQTCDGRRRVVTGCGYPDYDCGTRQLGRRWFVWTEAGRVFAFDLWWHRLHRTRRLAVKGNEIDAAHAGRRLYASVDRRILRATLPR